MSKFLFFAAALAIAQHDHKAAPSAKALSFTATVIDTGCHMAHATKGERHITCATACAKAGVPLALLDEATGTIYLPVAVNHKNQNERLLPFIEKKVKVTGDLLEKGGLKGISLKTIEAAP